jgi:hypothetical protein
MSHSTAVKTLPRTADNLEDLVAYLDDNVTGWQTRVTERLGGKYSRSHVRLVALKKRNNANIIETMLAIAEEHKAAKAALEERIRKAVAA